MPAGGAAWKAVDAGVSRCCPRPVSSSSCSCPRAKTPDTVVRNRGADHFRALLDNAKPVGEYFLESPSGRGRRRSSRRTGIARRTRGASHSPVATRRVAGCPRYRSRRSCSHGGIGCRPGCGHGVGDQPRIGVPVENRTNQGQGIGNKPLLKYVVQYPQLIEGHGCRSARRPLRTRQTQVCWPM